MPRDTVPRDTVTPAPGLRPAFAAPAPDLTWPAVAAPAPGPAPHRLAPLRQAAWDSALTATLDSARTERALAHRFRALYGRGQPGRSDSLAPAVDRGALGLDRKYADLAIDGEVRFELRTDRTINHRCTPDLLADPNSGCRGGFSAPRLDNTFNLRTGGIIGRRVHVNVDYDSQREAGANQNVQVYYEGLEDEIIRRIEVGTVSFRPPASRFLTAAIPANNFGVNATFEVGPVQVQTLAATQKGSVVAERTYTVGQTATTPQDRQVRDLDFETGRFFWVVDPRAVRGFPAVDILNLGQAPVDPTLQPVDVRVYRHRAIPSGSSVDPNLGGISAVAVNGEGQQFDQQSGLWVLLQPNVDYYLDPSGLWLALTTKLDLNDFLAVSYTVRAGAGLDSVGTFPSQSGGTSPNGVPRDTLLLVSDAQNGPTFGPFLHEMRQVYRVAGGDLDPASLQVNLQLNRSERPSSGAATYLALLGIAIPTDPTAFDRDNRLFPRTRDPGAGQVLRESYLVFPHLQPFADAQRVPNALERNEPLYQTPTSLLQSTQGPPAKYAFRFRYNSTGAGDRGSLNLNALQIREGTEKLTANGRTLEKGVDYSIDYATGQVSFLNPDGLFGTGTGTVTASFEENGIFAVAPTSIFGLATRYSLGETGAVNLITMYQREQTVYNRPQLGFEAKANLVTGLNTELHFKPSIVNRLLSPLLNAPAAAPSRLDIHAEAAMTRPDPNRTGAAYLEEFESDAGVPINLRETLWGWGSMPQRADGLETMGIGAFERDDAVQLTWQNLIASGGRAVQIRPTDIDTLFKFVGTQGNQFETPLWMTLHADTAGGVVDRNSRSHWTQARRDFRPRWRSIVTSLSATGADLTRDEYLEFWVYQPASHTADSAGVRLVLDLGAVNEDALAVAPTNFAVNGADTTYTGRQYVGVGQLDTERPSSTTPFNADTDDNGILSDVPPLVPAGNVDGDSTRVHLCRQQLRSTVAVYPWGDLSSRCTAGNGTLDTEDLNGDQTLNARGPNDNVFRYVVNLADTLASSKYFVRDGQTDAVGGQWKLYRIPLRSPDATIGSPNMRLVQHLRLSVVGAADQGEPDVVARFGLARMRLVGSPWARRAESPIQGFAGLTGQPQGTVIATIISTENAELGYQSPPGVLLATNRRDVGRDAIGTQISEKSLRVIAQDLGVGERAEAYLRFPAGPQNLLAYREMRIWAHGTPAALDPVAAGAWERGELQMFLKLGSDPENFYLYRSPARSGSWDPEVVVDLDVWRRLRADVEMRWLNGQGPNGAAECQLPGPVSPTAYVACEGNYVVYVGSPGVNPPNLAAVQEISAGLYRASGEGRLAYAEVWIDDIRMTRPVSEVGTALAFDARLTASDVGDISLALVRQDGQFRQIGQTPSYRTTGNLQLASSWRLDRFLPAWLGYSIPATVNLVRTSVDPVLLQGSDLPGAALPSLRRPRGWSANYSISLRRSKPGTHWLVKGLLDPLFVQATYTQGRSTTELSDASSDGRGLSAAYSLVLQRTGPKLPLGGLVDHLPGFMRNGELGRALREARIALAPSNVRWQTGVTRDASDLTNYLVPVRQPADSLLAAIQSLNYVWRNGAGLTWQPLGMLTLSGDLASTRDLRHYPDSSSVGRLAEASRKTFLGMDAGVERDRTVTTNLTLAPRVASWLRPRLTRSSNFILSRSLTSRPPVRAGDDSLGAFVLPQTLNNSRSTELGASIEIGRLLRNLGGDSSGLARAVQRLRPLDVSRRTSYSSTFDLAAFSPTVGYQLAEGGLEHFLGQFGTTAIGAGVTRTTTVSSGAELPLGFSATVSYSLLDADRYQRSGDRLLLTTSSQREWPVGSLRFTHTFLRGPITLLAVGSTVRQRRGTQTQPGVGGGAGLVSGVQSSAVNPDMQIGLRNGMALTLGFNSVRQQTTNTSSLTHLAQADWTGSFSYAFRLPRSLSPTRKMLRTSLYALSTTSETCMVTGTVAGCQIVNDLLRQELRGTVETDLLRSLSGGLSLGYSLNGSETLNRRISQFSLSANFQLSLFAGDYH
ncbi:MAG TPA: hypothetical protein VFS40_03965 [Gemmatimonadales bacterium]|nr:hypothetical protein [Gemmatimonadales bacterium]